MYPLYSPITPDLQIDAAELMRLAMQAAVAQQAHYYGSRGAASSTGGFASPDGPLIVSTRDDDVSTSQNNVERHSQNWWRWNVTADVTWSGIKAGGAVDGDWFLWTNVGTHTVTFEHLETGDSDSANIFRLPGGVDVEAGPGATAMILRDADASCWRVLLGSTSLTVEDDDGTPSYTSTSTLQFEGDDFTLTQPSPGVVKVASSGGAGITVWEADGTPTVADVTDLVFDQADGFTVTDLTGGFVQIDQADANISQAGKVSVGNQVFKGAKDFAPGSSPAHNIGLTDLAGQLFAALAVAGTVDTSPVLVIRTVTSAGVLKNQLNLDNNGLNLNTGVYSIGANNGASGTFTTVDGKTVTVTGGIITSIT